MKLWIVSDLHTNHFPWAPARVPEHAVTIIAGDVADQREDALIELIKLRARTQRPVVFVPGNHDIFGGPIDAFDGESRLLLAQDIHVLPSGQTVVIDGVRFVGATLWTDWFLFDTEFASQAWAARHMPEYQHVLGPDGGRLWPIHTSTAHDLHRHAIKQALSRPHDGPTVVVTHHAPSGRSIRGPLEEADAAFASDLEDMIARYHPQLWVHGHIHSASDYWIGGTRIICNPRGYEGPEWSENSGWIEDLVVEV